MNMSALDAINASDYTLDRLTRLILRINVILKTNLISLFVDTAKCMFILPRMYKYARIIFVYLS